MAAATPEMLTQQVIQLGADLAAARTEIQQLKTQAATLGQQGGGDTKQVHIIDRKTVVSGAVQVRGLLE